MKTFDYRTSIRFLEGFRDEEKLELYGAFGGTALYLRQIEHNKNFEENIRDSFFRVTAYLYEEPLLLLRQEVQEPGIYSAIIEAIAGGASKANEISTKIGEESAKCLKYINTLCELGILYKEFPFEGDPQKKDGRFLCEAASHMVCAFFKVWIYGCGNGNGRAGEEHHPQSSRRQGGRSGDRRRRLLNLR